MYLRYSLINFILILYNQLEFCFNQYNVHVAELSAIEHDCLYDYLDSFRYHKEGLVSYCIPQEIMKDNLCHGKEITFKELKTNNISIVDLFHWNAVMDIIDLYAKYLLFPELVNDIDMIYCNCSHLSRFGKFCQYETDQVNRRRIFSELVALSDNIDSNYLDSNTHFTCFIGIICQTNLFCLDWRQICNGIVDCDRGEDEPAELCLQMETNECDVEKEFRCKSGLCLPTSLAYDSRETCPDRSNKMKEFDEDVPKFLLPLCLGYPSLICDGINHGWKQFSCNNGQYISYSDLTLKPSPHGHTCINNRHLMYLKRLFLTTNEDQCWQALICLTGFNYLFSHVICLSNETIERNINDYCSNEFYFPSNSIVYSFVFFFYDKINRDKSWLTYSGPNYICYKKEYCPNRTWILLKHDLVCFHVDQQIFTWTNFYEYILHIFSSCYYHHSTKTMMKINEQMLYKCNLSDTFISIYRVKDKTRDCFFNEDENENIDLCSLKINDRYQCYTNQSQCIRQVHLRDKQYDCSDGSDEYFEEKTFFGCDDSICELHPWKKRNPAQIYRFTELCDNIVNYHLFSKQSNETDETDCEHWLHSCDSVYTKCDNVWNCHDGRDEMNCSGRSMGDMIRSTFHCQNNEHYCLQLINNTHINTTCLHLNRIHDGIIDCIGGTDERLTSICIDKYPIDHKRRFRCMNSSECIRPDQVCDRKTDCPFGDDEHICPWLIEWGASIFHCKNYPFHFKNRCNNNNKPFHDHYCSMDEQMWFCDLAMISSNEDKLMSYEPYPPEEEEETLNSNNNNRIILKSAEKQTQSLITNINHKLLCNFGFRFQSSFVSDRSYCFCSPTYYGDHCQYQSEHLVVILKTTIRYFMNPSTVFRFMIYLLNETDSIISYDEIVFNHIISFDLLQAYLTYERIKEQPLQQRTQSKFVRIDSYIINETHAQYISSWKFSVLFPFLPVNKLAVEISPVDQLFRFMNCRKSCGSHGKCKFYLNSRDVQYCWCEQGWFGETCQMKSSLSNLCASHAQYVILNNRTKCICPLGRSGRQCYITYNSCAHVQCKNNGTCLPIKQSTVESSCVCQIGYKGDSCEFVSSPANIIIGANITNQSSIPAIIVIWNSVMKNTLEQRFGFLYDNVTLPAVLIQETSIAPQFNFIRMFHNFSMSFYYAIIIRNFEGIHLNKNTSVLSTNRCKNVTELFNETILHDYSYLKRLKLYNLPCHQDWNLRCFFDEYRMCICTQEHKSSCFVFDHDYSSCNYCQNNGICLRSDIESDYWKFVCLCQECSFGNLCQFSFGNYFTTLDTLVGVDIKTGTDISFTQQPLIIHLTLTVLTILVLLNLILNTISIIILADNKLKQVGCDLYLLNLTIFSQLGLIVLFLRFIYMIVIQMSIIEDQLFVQISCLVLEYLVRLIPSIFDWLTACISIERTYMIIKDVHFTKMTALKTLKLSRWIILIVILMNILTTLHRLFYLTLVDEIGLTGEPQGHPWCVLDFQLTSWNIYEKVINLCHLCLPLILNISSMIFFILRKTQFEFTSTVRKHKRARFSILIEQLLKYRPLLLSTIIIILLEIPRFILTFTLSCFKYSWQRHVYLFGYLLSFLPLCCILLIYILPSPKHNQQMKLIWKKMLLNRQC